jgi:hypothetical protein
VLTAKGTLTTSGVGNGERMNPNGSSSGLELLLEVDQLEAPDSLFLLVWRRDNVFKLPPLPPPFSLRRMSAEFALWFFGTMQSPKKKSVSSYSKAKQQKLSLGVGTKGSGSRSFYNSF